MRTIIAVPGQSIFDIALLYCGDAALAYEIAMANVIDITITFESVTSLLIPDFTNNTAKVFEQQNIVFATGDVFNYWDSNRKWNDVLNWEDKYK